ncbi:MAG: TonB-dependent receptor [Paraglaciecola sp.]|uniref:TonB-dependent receptor plug domain-containing protein n=1 Tax=Paraglaciecola sp. TaxID=1920173 RepID=UPI003266058C
MFKITMSVLLVAVSQASYANQSSIEKVVVTGTRYAVLQSQSPVSVDVITAKTLQAISHGTLASALNYIPGVVVTRNQKDGYTVQMQGFGSDHVLVLIDSQPFVSPTGSSVDLDQIGVLDIERIEVMRGAGSVLYGSSAMGGVINIITRKLRSDHLKLNYQAGSYTNNAIESADLTHLLQLDGSKNLNGWQSSLSLQASSDPGFDYEPDTVAQSAPSSDKYLVNLGLVKAFENDLSLSNKLRYFNDAKEKFRYSIPGQEQDIRYISDVEQWQWDMGLANGQNWEVKSRVLNHIETSGDTNALRDADISLAQLDGQINWQLGDIDLVSGLTARLDKLNQTKQNITTGEIDSYEVDDESAQSIQGFTQASWSLADHELVFGTQIQHDSDFGLQSASRLNSLFNFGNSGNANGFAEDGSWQLRLGLGQSYRVPTLKDRFYVFDHSNLGYMVLGNEDLIPEEALTANAELNYRLSNTKIFDVAVNKLSLRMNLHTSKADNFITTVVDAEASAASGLLISRYENIDGADLNGFDISAQFAMHELDLQFSYSYISAKDDSDEHLSDRPTHQLKGNLNWSLPYDIHSLLYVVYESGEYPSSSQIGVARDHWMTVNLSINQSINQHWDWRAGIDNIFDNHQDETSISAGLLDVRPLSSRYIFVGISYTF